LTAAHKATAVSSLLRNPREKWRVMKILIIWSVYHQVIEPQRHSAGARLSVSMAMLADSSDGSSGAKPIEPRAEVSGSRNAKRPRFPEGVSIKRWSGGRWVSRPSGVRAKVEYAPRTIRRIEKPPRSGKKRGGFIRRPSHQSASVPIERCKVRDAHPTRHALSSSRTGHSPRPKRFEPCRSAAQNVRDGVNTPSRLDGQAAFVPMINVIPWPLYPSYAGYLAMLAIHPR
jgi:hypothetical protein